MQHIFETLRVQFGCWPWRLLRLMTPERHKLRPQWCDVVGEECVFVCVFATLQLWTVFWESTSKNWKFSLVFKFLINLKCRPWGSWLGHLTPLFRSQDDVSMMETGGCVTGRRKEECPLQEDEAAVCSGPSDVFSRSESHSVGRWSPGANQHQDTETSSSFKPELFTGPG